MTCSSPAREEVALPKKERIDLEADLGDTFSPLASCFEEVAMNEDKKKGSKLANDMSQTVRTFSKYPLPKTGNSIEKTSVEELEATARTRSGVPFFPLIKLSNMPRGPSLLEQSILPGIRSDQPDAMGSPGDGDSSASQLTIFYAGVVNVYNNVTVDKAKAIMLLARESSLSKTSAVEPPKTENKKPLHHSQVLPSSKSQADLPMARKLSLQHFLERRRHRITSKSPYSHQPTEEKKTEPMKDEGSDEARRGIPLSLWVPLPG